MSLNFSFVTPESAFEFIVEFNVGTAEAMGVSLHVERREPIIVTIERAACALVISGTDGAHPARVQLRRIGETLRLHLVVTAPWTMILVDNAVSTTATIRMDGMMPDHVSLFAQGGDVGVRRVEANALGAN